MKNINCKYLSDVITYQDYYPFGMQMPGRSFSSENYRFGFQAMRKMTKLREAEIIIRSAIMDMTQG